MFDLVASEGLLPSSARRWRIAMATPLWANNNPWAKGDVDCPGGCNVRFSASDDSGADVRLVHDDSESRHVHATDPNQLIGLMASETFDLSTRTDEHYERYQSELTFRVTSFFRDAYMTHLLGVMRLRARGGLEVLKDLHTWDDLFGPPPTPLNQKRPLQETSIAWASSHCNSRSGREDFVRELAAVLPVTIAGRGCLANVPNQKHNEEEIAVREREMMLSCVRACCV